MTHQPTTCAIAISTTGERYLKAKSHLIKQLQWCMPGIKVVDIDLRDARKFLPDVPEEHLVYFSRLAIPLMPQFKPYERVLYMDVDVDIRSGRFAGILLEETGEDGLAAVADIWQSKYRTHLKRHFPEYNAPTYFNAGIIVFDLWKIDKAKYADALQAGLEYNSKTPLRWRDQDLLNALFRPKELDVRYNYIFRRGNVEEVQPYLLHYAGGHSALWRRLDAEECESVRDCVVVALDHDCILSFIRSYFASGNTMPLLVVRASSANWLPGDFEYCKLATEFCGGAIVECDSDNTQDAVNVAIDKFKPNRWMCLDAHSRIAGDLSRAFTREGQNEAPEDMTRSADQGLLCPAPFEPASYRAIALPIPAKDVAIDAVFVIGTGSPNNNEELRYALRNLAKHCPFVRDVYIIGECPDWVNKSAVKYIKWPDRFKHAKDANIIDKLRHACEQEGIAQRILFCSDDQFQTRVCQWEDFSPRYLRRYKSDDPWYSGRKRAWHDRLRATLEREKKRRAAARLDITHIFYYEPHMWMQIDRDKFIEYAKWSDYAHRKDTIIASGYFNFVDANGHPHDKNYDHVFMGAGTPTLPKATHIAYTDSGFERAKSFLKQLFPEKCRFEVGDAGQTQARQISIPAVATISVPYIEAEPVRPRASKTIFLTTPARMIDREAIRAAIRGRIFGKISL